MKGIKVIALLKFLLFLSLLALPFDGYAGTVPKSPKDSKKTDPAIEKGRLVRTTGKGTFSVLMVTEGKELVVGENSLNLVVSDRQNRKVTGAEVALIPWLPSGGHGVWEKPVVTDRGGGNYHVDNIVLVRSGHWDLKVTIRKGSEADQAIFSFPVGLAGQTSQRDPDEPKGKYLRTVEYYKVPNVTLLNQDGKKIRLRSFLDAGKPVVIDFIYTTCTTICPILSAGFSDLRDELGKSSRTVQLVSISIDPEHDRPERMKKYLERYNSGEGWDFLTGSREDIALVLKAFDASVRDKMSHRPLYLFHGPKSDEWVRVEGLIGTYDLMREFWRIENK